MANKMWAYALPVAIGWVVAVGLLAMARNSQASMKVASRADASAVSLSGGIDGESNADNADLWRMIKASEKEHAENKPGVMLPIAEIAKRDFDRIERTRQLYKAGLIVTANDCYNAAVLLQRAHSSEDLILAHDLAFLAVSMGLKKATWLTAETEDKYLISVGKPQRFATQYEPNTHGMPRLYAVDPVVTDGHRLSVGASTLSEAAHRFGAPLFND